MRPHFVYSTNFHSWHGPRRAVWFILGAASATFWIAHKEAHRRNETDERYFGHCFRPPVSPMQPRPPVDVSAPDEPPAQWRPRVPPASMPWGYPESHRDRQWEEEKIKLQAIGRQAEEVMAKLSEDTLTSVMSTMESLKTKLAEHRAQREEAQRQSEKQFEEQRKNPHRFV